MEQTGNLSVDFWSTSAVSAALATCDFATLLHEIREAHGWTQEELATAVGYSQSWVSKVLRQKQELTIYQARKISVRLGIPVHLLRFGSVTEGEDPTRRRDFNKAITLALISVPSSRGIDESTADALAAITRSQRRLDSTVPARELSKTVVAHVEFTSQLQSKIIKSPLTARIAATVSETAGFAAWLHADMLDIGTARAYYRLAIEKARVAGNRLLTGYMIGSFAQFEIECGIPTLGLTLINRAHESIGSNAHSTANAWLASIEALGHAAGSRNQDAAIRSILRAEKAIVNASDGPPPWPWVYSFDHAKLARYRALIAVRLQRPNEALHAFSESLVSAQSAPKQRAMTMIEVATAARQAGESDHDNRQVDEAFRLASEALEIGNVYLSERVIERVRAFRHEYLGPKTARIVEFDRKLRATLP